MLRLAPYGLSLAELRARPHGIDLGALKPRLDELLCTESGRVRLAPGHWPTRSYGCANGSANRPPTWC